MAHNINRMVFAGETPWHGLGTQLPENGTYEEIVQAAGFYVAEKRPLFAAGVQGAVPGLRAVVRTDTQQFLAAVSERYTVVQFSDIARTIVEACGKAAVFHTAGTLGESGSRGWLLGELPNPIRVRGDESETRKYFMGYTGHDGSTAVTLKNVATRVVCQNTLGVALGESGSQWSIRHTANAGQRLEDAGKAFRQLVVGFEQFGQLANVLAATRFTDAQLETTLDAVLPVPKDDERHTRIENQRDTVRRLAAHGRGIGPSLRGTAWAAFQGYTEYADHHRTVRQLSDGSARAARLDSILFGTGAALKSAAFASILSTAGIRQAA